MAVARRVLIGIATLAVCCGWAASSASAAFPGRNGLLVAEPITGGGLTLLTSNGTVVGRICGDATLCGAPAHPRWSPDGSAIVFANASAARIGIVAPDGSCLWCMLGPALTTVHGSAPAFTADGRSITLTGTSGGVWRADLGSATSSRALGGAASDAASASTGELAVVRGGAVWLRARGRSGSLHRLASGAAPSFSPDGSKLAIARGGWIAVVGVRGIVPHRLVRGTAPAWSPDGREIAYIGADGSVQIVSMRNRRSRSLGIRARSVDWQPLTTAGSRSCTPKAGWRVIARDATAVVAYAPGNENEGSFGGWYGCLKAVNAWQPLLQDTAGDAGYDTTIDRVSIAGRFVLLASTYSDKYQNCSHSLVVDDIATGSTAPLASSDCSYGGPATLAFGSGVLSEPGFAAWVSARSLPTYAALNAISCPSVSLCVAGDQAGALATSTDPLGGRSAWQVFNAAGNAAVDSVSCPTTDFCAAAASSNGSVLTSTEPTGGRAAWTTVTADHDPGIIPGATISCPSAGLCVLADGSGNILTATDPTGGASRWRSVHVLTGTPPGFSALTCPSVSLCVALDRRGEVVTSTNPTGTAADWKIAPVDSNVGFFEPYGISCPSTSLCVAVNGTPHLLTSTNPTAGTSAWNLTSLTPTWGSLQAVSCPSSSLCVAADNGGNLYTSTDPTGGAAAWHVAAVDTGTPITSISCPTTTVCLAVDVRGNVLTSNAPLGGVHAWSSGAVDVPDCAAQGTSCIVEQLYVHDDHGSRLIDATPPGNGGVIANLAFAEDGLVLTWTHAGVERRLPVR